MKSYVVRNEGWIGIVLSTLVALFLSAYVGFFTALPGDNSAGHPLSFEAKLSRLGPINSFFVIGVLGLLTQVLLRKWASVQELRDSQSEGERLSEALLESVVCLMSARRKQTLRALVTLPDRDMRVRRVACGANIRVDPEAGVPVPLAFGVAGDAFMLKSMQIGDIDDANRGRSDDGSVVPGIWSSIRSVLAFPMLTADGAAFGTVNFDSDKPSDTSGFSERNIQDALVGISQIVTYLMRSRSPNGTARFPG
jgi:hypothetical protein